jgi:pimeloyl-ACP methyl ester carboxylesterase
MRAFATPRTEQVAVGDTQLTILQGGSGTPVLVLHGIEGHEGWLAFHSELASSQSVLAPSHPGYGHTPAPEWITSIPHQAIFYNWYLQAAGFGSKSVDVVGVGIGGWIAALMAIMCGGPLRHLVLVDAAGIRPTTTQPLDVFVTPWREVIDRAFHDPSASAEYQRLYSAPIPEYGGIREAGRMMSIRMCFKPYMHDPSLRAMLAKIDVPTLIVWGREDRLVPLECGETYAQAVPGARLHILEDCGHFAHLEQPNQLADLVREFCGGGA